MPEVNLETQNYIKSLIGKSTVVSYSERNKHLIATLSSGVRLWVLVK